MPNAFRMVLMAGLTVCSLGAAGAQPASAVLAELADGGPRLAGAVADAVSSDVDAADDFCNAALDGLPHVRIGVGTGLAEAFLALRQAGNDSSADEITATVCACDPAPGAIGLAYAMRLGVPPQDVCSIDWDSRQAGRSEGLYWIRAEGAAAVTSN